MFLRAPSATGNCGAAAHNRPPPPLGHFSPAMQRGWTLGARVDTLFTKTAPAYTTGTTNRRILAGILMFTSHPLSLNPRSVPLGAQTWEGGGA